MPSFKEIYANNEDENKSKKVKKTEPSSAAASILSAHAVKDKRLNIRLNSQLYNQFAQINKKLGTTNASIINMLMAQYVNEHKDLLD